MSEREPRYQSPDALPAELAEALAGADYACLTTATEHGTAFVIKAPAEEIKKLHGPLPIELTHELYRHPAAPVIRMLLRCFDDPLAPFAMESFINVADEQQRAEYAMLSLQDSVPLLFYDEGLVQRLAKQLVQPDPAIVTEVLAAAETLRGHIPLDRYDFDRTKYAIQKVTHW